MTTFDDIRRVITERRDWLQKVTSRREIYEAAGYKPDRGNAARLNAIESIRARVREAACAKGADIGIAPLPHPRFGNKW